MKERNHFYRNLAGTAAILLLCWIIKSAEVLLGFDWGNWGILPKHLIGLRGILFSPLLHGDWNHLISNSFPFLVLAMVLLNAFPQRGWSILALLWVSSGFLVWWFAESRGYHIGMSGVIYGLVAFLITSGLLRKDRQSGAVAILVGLMYGGMVFGFVPTPGVSWESHLYGSLSGFVFAWIFRKSDLPEEGREEIPEPDDDRHFFEKHPEQQVEEK